MEEKNKIEQIWEEKKENIQKTIDHPISGMVKWNEIKKTISTSKKQENLSENQISLNLDKYENRLIKKRKFFIN